MSNRYNTYTLCDWYEYLGLKRWRRWRPKDWRMTEKRWRNAHWRTKFWWLRQRLYRIATAQRVREWRNEAYEMTSSYAHLIDEWYGVSRREQMDQIFQLHIRRGIAPWEYYAYKLYQPNRYRNSDRYIFHYPHLQLINFFILHTIGHYETPTQGDKRRWHEWADKNNVSTPRVLASFEDGCVTSWKWNGVPNELPEYDLFCKPAMGYGGEGASLWIYSKGGFYDHTNPGNKLSKQELISHLKSQKSSLILQERLINHPDMDGFSAFGLATCRLVTARSVGGEVVPILASLKLPCGNSVTDNPSSGSVVAPIDITSGYLNVAVPKFPRQDGDRFERHPDTGRQIANEMFPQWNQVKELAIAAHEKLRDTHFVGWDITLSTEGPVIIEPNAAFGASSAEYPSGIPLTDTKFGKIFSDYMQNMIVTKSI